MAIDIRSEANSLSVDPSGLTYWRIAQVTVLIVCLLIWFCLIFFPSIGLLVFWNLSIPVAPLLFLLFTGVWRNICPLGLTSLLPRYMKISKKKKLTQTQTGILNLMGLCFLLLIVPLRHVFFNKNGLTTSLLLLCVAIAAITLGIFYEWKSAWCSGLCPVHPIEKLYGGNVAFSVNNAHCSSCENCVIPCPDSTPNINPRASRKTIWHHITGYMITGGFPGFIWGWFHVPDQNDISTLGVDLTAFRYPLLGMGISLFIYFLLDQWLSWKNQAGSQGAIRLRLNSVFSASSLTIYYGFRIPQLFGFGQFGNSGMLVDLHELIPKWVISLTISILSLFFFYWLVFRGLNKKSWTKRNIRVRQLQY